MARWQNGNALPLTAVHQNQLDRRFSGVVGYDQADHPQGIGPLAVSIGSSNTIDLEINGGDAQISGEIHTATQGGLTLPDGEVGGGGQPRRDIIYVAEGGSIEYFQGSPGSNRLWEPEADGNSATHPTGANAPVPEGNDTAPKPCCVIAAVWVPPGATDTDAPDLDVTDLRRPAIRPRLDAWQDPNVESSLSSADASYDVTKPIHVEPGETLHLYSLSQIHPFGWDSTWNIEISLVELRQDPVDPDVMNQAGLWETTDAHARDDPLYDLSVAATDEPGTYGIRQRNLGDETFEMPFQGIGFTASYRKFETSQFE